jgi:hypothetical protein
MNSVSRRNGNTNKNGNTNLYSLPSLYRGMYNRIAAKVGCDPSYVSRVARGERRSDEVAKALQVEIQKTWALANGNSSRSDSRARKSR